MSKVKNLQSKEYFFALSVNLAHTCNFLSFITSDVVRLMGTLPFDQIQSQNQHGKQEFNKKKQSNTTKVSNQNVKLSSNASGSEKYFLSELENQKQTQQPRNIMETNPKNLEKNKNFPFQIFQTEQKPKSTINQKPIQQNPYKYLFYSEQKSSESSNQKLQRQSSNYSLSSKTQTAEVVRSNQNDKKLQAKRSFDQLNQYALENNNTYQINVRQPYTEEKKVSKQKSPFFDLFDSSQIQNYDQSPIPSNFQRQNNQDFEIDRPYYTQTQQIRNDSRKIFKTASQGLYTPQMKKQKPLENSKKNGYQNNFNLLDLTQWSNSGQNNMFQVQEEIDEIESSGKKPPVKSLLGNRKDVSKNEVQSENVEYIPRREEKGRKKSDRQGLQGSQCPDCMAFYSAISDESRSFKDMCQCTSRHKSSTTFMGKHTVQNFSQQFKLD